MIALLKTTKERKENREKRYCDCDEVAKYYLNKLIEILWQLKSHVEKDKRDDGVTSTCIVFI